VRRILAVLLLVFLLEGCGGGEKRAATGETRPAEAGTPAGFTVRTARGEGLSIAVPHEWRSIDTATALRGESVQQFERDNPAAAAAVEALARPNSPMKFVAIAPSGGEFATNVNVLVSRIPSAVSFSRWTAAETAQISALKPTELRKSEAQLPVGRAYRLRYHARLRIRGAPRDLAIHQYMVKRGPFLYVITFTTDAANEGGLTNTFEQSARTFRLSS
jgi:hypothetical protein